MSKGGGVPLACAKMEGCCAIRPLIIVQGTARSWVINLLHSVCQKIPARCLEFMCISPAKTCKGHFNLYRSALQPDICREAYADMSSPWAVCGTHLGGLEGLQCRCSQSHEGPSAQST